MSGRLPPMPGATGCRAVSKYRKKRAGSLSPASSESQAVGCSQPAIHSPTRVVFPNPAGDYVNLVMTSEEVINTLYIYDFAGRVVYRKDLIRADQGSHWYRLNLSALPAGIYTVAIINKTSQMSGHKFVKLKL